MIGRLPLGNRPTAWPFFLLLTAVLMLAGCGGEGGENGAAEGPEDDTPFVSSGEIHRAFDGVEEKLTLAYDETFAGLLGDTEIAATFDETGDMFIGRVRNEASAAVCDVSIAVVLDPAMAGETALDLPLIAGLRAGERSNFTVPASAMSFSQWTLQVETFMCSSAPAGGASGEGSEGGGEGSAGEHGGGSEGSEGAEHGTGGEHGGGGEGSGEHGSGGEGSEGGGEGGGESGEEANPSIPVTDPYAGENAGQTFDFRYEAATGLFRGTVANTSAGLICDSRTEIHLGTPMGVVELGPTIREDLEPGDVLYVVMYQDGPEPDTYILHPEASACP